MASMQIETLRCENPVASCSVSLLSRQWSFLGIYSHNAEWSRSFFRQSELHPGGFYESNQHRYAAQSFAQRQLLLYDTRLLSDQDLGPQSDYISILAHFRHAESGIGCPSTRLQELVGQGSLLSQVSSGPQTSLSGKQRGPPISAGDGGGFGKPAAARWPVGDTESSVIGRQVSRLPLRGLLGVEGMAAATARRPSRNKSWRGDGRHPIGCGSALLCVRTKELKMLVKTAGDQTAKFCLILNFGRLVGWKSRSGS